MSGATDFTSCTAITSGTDISSNNCVTDTHRYIQYQTALTSVSANTPTFQTECFLINGWTIDEKARKYLKEGTLDVSNVVTE